MNDTGPTAKPEGRSSMKAMHLVPTSSLKPRTRGKMPRGSSSSSGEKKKTHDEISTALQTHFLTAGGDDPMVPDMVSVTDDDHQTYASSTVSSGSGCDAGVSLGRGNALGWTDSEFSAFDGAKSPSKSKKKSGMDDDESFAASDQEWWDSPGINNQKGRGWLSPVKALKAIAAIASPSTVPQSNMPERVNQISVSVRDGSSWPEPLGSTQLGGGQISQDLGFEKDDKAFVVGNPSGFEEPFSSQCFNDFDDGSVASRKSSKSTGSATSRKSCKSPGSVASRKSCKSPGSVASRKSCKSMRDVNEHVKVVNLSNRGRHSKEKLEGTQSVDSDMDGADKAARASQKKKKRISVKVRAADFGLPEDCDPKELEEAVKKWSKEQKRKASGAADPTSPQAQGRGRISSGGRRAQRTRSRSRGGTADSAQRSRSVDRRRHKENDEKKDGEEKKGADDKVLRRGFRSSRRLSESHALDSSHHAQDHSQRGASGSLE